MLKKIKTHLLVLVCLTSLCGMSQTTTPSRTETNKEVRSLLRILSGSSDRKRIPSNAYIEVCYINGLIGTCSEINGEIQTLIIKNGNTGELVFTSLIVPGEYVPIMLDEGRYELTIELQDGRMFCGEMYI